MRLYGLKEDKCTEYSPSEAANVYEKPINRRNIPAYSNEVFDEFLNEQQQGQGRNDVAEEKRKIAEDFHKVFIFYYFKINFKIFKDFMKINTYVYVSLKS